ncbi:MAG: FixH family protein [Proteobacteria bacterium]|nr:FixH family protein [Pseudomonadota bacterium]
MGGRLKAWWRRVVKTAGVAPACALLLLLPFETQADELIVTYTTPAGAPQVNRMHSWILHIEDAAGVTIEGALIEIVGGMPEHDHGLPTLPRVTEELGDGDYKLDGMRFHMSGYWEIVVTITTDEGASKVTIPLQL